MRSNKGGLNRLLMVALLGFHASAWAYVTAEDQQIIDAAGCEEIVKEHKNYAAAAQKVADEIRHAQNGEVAGNVLGVATLAVFGLGFFSWDDHSDAKTNLAELAAYRDAIAAAGRGKKCGL